MSSSAWAKWSRSASVDGAGRTGCGATSRVGPLRWAIAGYHRGVRRVGAQAESGQQALQGRGAQRLGGAVACPARPVEPAAALDGLGCADHDGQLLGDQRPSRRPCHSASSTTTTHSCQTIQVTLSGIRSPKVDAAPALSPSACCGAYQIRRGRSPARFIASAALPSCSSAPLVMKSALPTTVIVRPSLSVAHQRAAVAAGQVDVADLLVGVGGPNCTVPARFASRRAQSGISGEQIGAADPDAGGQRLARPRGRLQQQPVAGKRRPVGPAGPDRGCCRSRRPAAGCPAGRPVPRRRRSWRRRRRRRGPAAG